jgi:hypothetical protein
MHRRVLQELSNEIEYLVDEAVMSRGIINVSALAERIRRNHENLNIALEDVEAMVLERAQTRLSPIEFDGMAFESSYARRAGSN